MISYYIIKNCPNCGLRTPINYGNFDGIGRSFNMGGDAPCSNCHNIFEFTIIDDDIAYDIDSGEFQVTNLDINDAKCLLNYYNQNLEYIDKKYKHQYDNIL